MSVIEVKGFNQYTKENVVRRFEFVNGELYSLPTFGGMHLVGHGATDFEAEQLALALAAKGGLKNVEIA